MTKFLAYARKHIILFCLLLQVSFVTIANPYKCYNNNARAWWNVLHYSINIEIDTLSGNIQGSTTITAAINSSIGDSLQIDLQTPMQIKRIICVQTNTPLAFTREGNIFWITHNFKNLVKNNQLILKIEFYGIPHVAAKPPWDGGLVLSKDDEQKSWIGMACQGVGASVWLPCKDLQSDEPDSGVLINIKVPTGLTAISNGQLKKQTNAGQYSNWLWQVKNAINIYNITFYIGDYVNWTDTFAGKNGALPMSFYCLKNNEPKAKKHFEVVKSMLQCFEEKIGPYPFYDDGYQLVESPYLGMEHQSAIAYGNQYKMGYKGKDRSKTGIGLLFDFIIIHESGHEWFGNSITAYDKAENWIHEGFTSYAETIFIECMWGKQKAYTYQQGKKSTILNDKPVMNLVDSCQEGSSDMYDKAGFLIHTIRILLQDDKKFYAMLSAINSRYQKSFVSSKELEDFINNFSGNNFSSLFDQYLRKKELPVLMLKKDKQQLSYQWANCVPDFDMPVTIFINGKQRKLYATTQKQSIATPNIKNIKVDPNFLIDLKIQ